MILNAPPTKTGTVRLILARKFGAAIAALSFFGAIAAAPLSVSAAFAVAPGATNVSATGSQRLSTGVSNPTIYFGTAEATELAAVKAPANALYSLESFMFSGVVNWGGNKFTYYSQQVLPGEGLAVPGRHVNAAGYVSDADGYLVLAGSAPKGTVFDTPFGYQGKIYDRGTVGNHLDVYIR